MRIILFFVIGLFLSFYLAELLSLIWRKHFQELFNLHIHHSAVGFFLFVIGILIFFFGRGFLGEPNNTLFSIFIVGCGFGMIIHHLLSESFIVSERIERDLIKKHESLIERILEILPGFLTWIALTSPLWLSFALPFAVAYLILMADIYWLFSAIKIAILIYIGFYKMEQVKKMDWQKKIEEDFLEWNKYYHLILVPTYKEGLEILIPTFEAIANSRFPAKKIFLAVGFEAWDDPARIERVANYLKDNARRLGGVFITIHDLQDGEVRGPGTNRNFIVKNVKLELEKRKIDFENVFATTLDADFCIHPQFLSGALYKYLSTPEDVRDKRSFTGVFLYNNNYWQAPTPMRVIATGTAFWQLSEMVGSDKYINFASLSINFQSLVNIGGWMPDKVNDDAGFYWKSYYHFAGDYKVIPHYLPISADAVLDVTLLKTFQNQYLQLKRWAYGVEHIPFIVKSYFASRKIDFWDKTDKLIFIIWSYFKWGTLALFITFGGLFIPLINPDYAKSVVYYNLSMVSSWILTAAFLGLFSTIYFNEKIAPQRPKNWSIFKKIWSYLQWVLVPIVLVSITTLPAIDAQTSLMFKRYLQFRVTNKMRK